MDTGKETETEEKNEDAEKEVEGEEGGNPDNVSNHGGDSGNNSEVMEDPEEPGLQPDPPDPSQEEQTPVVKNRGRQGKGNRKEDKGSKVQDDKQSDGATRHKLKNNHKEENVNGKKKVREGKPFTKVVIRRLPPTMTKEVLLDQVSPLPSYDYFYFVEANMSSPGSYSRAYINFLNQNDLFDFTTTFDNYVFIDAKGHEYPAIVEFAPYQRVPKVRTTKKKDSLMGTLESDPVYITFKEQLLAEALENSKTTNKQHYFETEINESEEVVTTPLLEFLKVKRAEKDRIREERREDRKRKEMERKLLKQKTKDKLPQEEEIEIKVVDDAGVLNKSEETSSSFEGDTESVDGGNAVPPKRNSADESDNNVRLTTDRSDNTNRIEGRAGRSEEGEPSRVYYRRGKSHLKSFERREASKYSCWEGTSSNRYRYRTDKYPSNTRRCEANNSSDESVLQPPKDKKEGVKDKDNKRSKNKDKDDRFVKTENRSREFKNKGGKSYREERLKQAEKREEKKKKETEEVRESREEEAVEEELKDEERLWNDKKKWRYGGRGDSKASSRTFTRRREEKRRDGVKASARARKSSGDDQHKTEGNQAKVEQTSGTEPCKEPSDQDQGKGNGNHPVERPERKERLHKESSVDSEEGVRVGKDPRAERRIRNKDRPSLEIYRPGMGKFSRQRLEKEKPLGSTDESPSHSPSPTPTPTNTSTSTNTNNK